MSILRNLLPLAVVLVLPLLAPGVAASPADGPPAQHAKNPSHPPEQTPLRLRFVALERVAGEDPAPPPSLLSRYPGNRLMLSYQLCISADGRVSSVRRRSGAADADSFMLSTLRAWRYPPQPANTLTCMTELFEFSQ
ncbi:MAG TPA: hypothetical protein PKI03_29525 [Pseudomonadota bacterium]|nr:hypothetical protein [Pseudomonadota bacterium]